MSTPQDFFDAVAADNRELTTDLVRADPALAASTNNRGQTGLLVATDNGFRPIVQALLAAGADPNAPDANGIVPLHRVYDPDIARDLLAAGADPNAADANGDRPAHHAARWNRLEVLKVLVEANADTSLTNGSGETALERARKLNNSDVVDWLKENSNDLKPGDDKLHRAAIALLEFEQACPEFYLALRLKQLDISADDLRHLADDPRARKILNPGTFDIAREVAINMAADRPPHPPMEAAEIHQRVAALLPLPDDAQPTPPPQTLEEVQKAEVEAMLRRMGSPHL